MKYCLPLLMLLMSVNGYAEYYKCVDADGKMQYLDKQAQEGDCTPVKSSHEAPSSAPPAARNVFEQEADLKKEQKAKDEAAKKTAQQEAAVQTKKKNCEISRNNLQTLQNAPLVTTYNAKGEASVMDDSARRQGIAEANKAISENCN
jgi:Domain of unknown function (DUF4124)